MNSTNDSQPAPDNAQPSLKFAYSVAEVAERWDLSEESIRRLIRNRTLRTLRGFRPFRITLDEIRRYETYDEATERRKEILRRLR